MPHKPWFIYILRCADNSLYTGITTDINKRVDQHNGQINSPNNRDTNKGAKYTRGRRPVTLVYQEYSASRSAASKREHEIKTLKKPQKEQLIVTSIKAAAIKTRQTCNLLT